MNTVPTHYDMPFGYKDWHWLMSHRVEHVMRHGWLHEMYHNTKINNSNIVNKWLRRRRKTKTIIRNKKILTLLCRLTQRVKQWHYVQVEKLLRLHVWFVVVKVKLNVKVQMIKVKLLTNKAHKLLHLALHRCYREKKVKRIKKTNYHNNNNKVEWEKSHGEIDQHGVLANLNVLLIIYV